MNEAVVADVENDLLRYFNINYKFEGDIAEVEKNTRLLGSLLNVYDDAWHLDGFKTLIAAASSPKDQELVQKSKISDADRAKLKETVADLKRYLIRADLGYMATSCSSLLTGSDPQRFLRLIEALIDKCKQRHGQKLKTVVLQITAKQDRKKRPNPIKCNDDGVKTKVVEANPFCGKEIPRTPFDIVDGSFPPTSDVESVGEEFKVPAEVGKTITNPSGRELPRSPVSILPSKVPEQTTADASEHVKEDRAPLREVAENFPLKGKEISRVPIEVTEVPIPNEFTSTGVGAKASVIKSSNIIPSGQQIPRSPLAVSGDFNTKPNEIPNRPSDVPPISEGTSCQENVIPSGSQLPRTPFVSDERQSKPFLSQDFEKFPMKSLSEELYQSKKTSVKETGFGQTSSVNVIPSGNQLPRTPYIPSGEDNKGKDVEDPATPIRKCLESFQTAPEMKQHCNDVPSKHCSEKMSEATGAPENIGERNNSERVSKISEEGIDGLVENTRKEEFNAQKKEGLKKKKYKIPKKYNKVANAEEEESIDQGNQKNEVDPPKKRFTLKKLVKSTRAPEVEEEEKKEPKIGKSSQSQRCSLFRDQLSATNDKALETEVDLLQQMTTSQTLATDKLSKLHVEKSGSAGKARVTKEKSVTMLKADKKAEKMAQNGNEPNQAKEATGQKIDEYSKVRQARATRSQKSAKVIDVGVPIVGQASQMTQAVTTNSNSRGTRATRRNGRAVKVSEAFQEKMEDTSKGLCSGEKSENITEKEMNVDAKNEVIRGAASKRGHEKETQNKASPEKQQKLTRQPKEPLCQGHDGTKKTSKSRGKKSKVNEDESETQQQSSKSIREESIDCKVETSKVRATRSQKKVEGVMARNPMEDLQESENLESKSSDKSSELKNPAPKRTQAAQLKGSSSRNLKRDLTKSEKMESESSDKSSELKNPATKATQAAQLKGSSSRNLKRDLTKSEKMESESSDKSAEVKNMPTKMTRGARSKGSSSRNLTRDLPKCEKMELESSDKLSEVKNPATQRTRAAKAKLNNTVRETLEPIPVNAQAQVKHRLSDDVYQTPPKQPKARTRGVKLVATKTATNSVPKLKKVRQDDVTISGSETAFNEADQTSVVPNSPNDEVYKSPPKRRNTRRK